MQLNVVALIVVVLMLAWSAASARADGDPASDVLASQLLFLPGDSGIPARQQAELSSLLQAANRAGYPLRVAVVTTPADLGSVGALWRQPSSYAHFLGLELSLVYRGRLLVAMPNGFGLYAARGPSAAERSASASSAQPGTGVRLGNATIYAVQRLAAAAGHRISVARSQTVPAPPTGAGDVWIVYAAGALIVALAWAASLRAVPLRRHRPASPLD